jgi:hypothetical protein
MQDRFYRWGICPATLFALLLCDKVYYFMNLMGMNGHVLHDAYIWQGHGAAYPDMILTRL